MVHTSWPMQFRIRIYRCRSIHIQMEHAQQNLTPLTSINSLLCNIYFIAFGFFWFHTFNTRRHSTTTTKQKLSLTLFGSALFLSRYLYLCNVIVFCLFSHDYSCVWHTWYNRNPFCFKFPLPNSLSHFWFNAQKPDHKETQRKTIGYCCNER